jgi:hypothetical protein
MKSQIRIRIRLDRLWTEIEKEEKNLYLGNDRNGRKSSQSTDFYILYLMLNSTNSNQFWERSNQSMIKRKTTWMYFDIPLFHFVINMIGTRKNLPQLRFFRKINWNKEIKKACLVQMSIHHRKRLRKHLSILMRSWSICSLFFNLLYLIVHQIRIEWFIIKQSKYF